MPGPFGRVSAPPPHFPVGGPVPASDLVGRETYIRRLGERLIDAVLENVSGIERSFEQAKAIAAGMRPSVKVKYEHIELALQLARETNAQRFFEGALDLPRALAARSGKRVVVIFDEFQAAGRLGPRVFDVMRARFQAQRGVAYAFLGSEEGILEQLFSEKGRAFYRFAVPIDLARPAGTASASLPTTGSPTFAKSSRRRRSRSTTRASTVCSTRPADIRRTPCRSAPHCTT